MSLQRLTSFIWYFITRKAEHTEVVKFKNRLWIPPKGADIPDSSPWSAANETGAFEAFKAQATQGASAITK